MSWLTIIIYLGGIAFCCYMLIVAWVASKNVEGAPRRDMYVCDKHGPMPESSTVKLFDGEVLDHVSADGKTIRGPARMCPICFEERVKTAKQRLRN